MFRIEMLPAREGDCLVVTYGDNQAPRRILIDGGRKATYNYLRNYLNALPENDRVFELMIITHVDRDHIEGILKLVRDPQIPVSFRDIWFNGYHHLNDGEFEVFSPVQGEVLTAELVKRAQVGEWQWNGWFGDAYKRAAVLPGDNRPLAVPLAGGMELILLSPSRIKLTELAPEWEEKCREAGLVAGAAAQDPAPEGFEFLSAIDIDALAEEPFEADDSKPNGSSIAVLAQYAGKKALLAGDAHVDLLEASIDQLRDSDSPLEVDLFKLPHHGSRKNLSKSLLQSLRCKHYLVSTNGSYFDHPDPVAMSRLIKYGGQDMHIWFNYSSTEARIWDVPSWRWDWSYTPHYPAADNVGYQCIELD